jgi:hypothetical protein
MALLAVIPGLCQRRCTDVHLDGKMYRSLCFKLRLSFVGFVNWEMRMAMPTDVNPNGFEGDTPPDRKNCRIYVNEDGLLVLDQEPLRRGAPRHSSAHLAPEHVLTIYLSRTIMPSC